MKKILLTLLLLGMQSMLLAGDPKVKIVEIKPTGGLKEMLKKTVEQEEVTLQNLEKISKNLSRAIQNEFESVQIKKFTDIFSKVADTDAIMKLKANHGGSNFTIEQKKKHSETYSSEAVRGSDEDKERTRKWIYIYTRVILALTGCDITPDNLLPADQMCDEKFISSAENFFQKVLNKYTDKSIKNTLQENLKKISPPPARPHESGGNENNGQEKSHVVGYAGATLLISGLLAYTYYYFKKNRKKNDAPQS